MLRDQNCVTSEIVNIEELEPKEAPGHISIGPLTIVWDDL